MKVRFKKILKEKQNFIISDANDAVARAAYAFSELAIVYPITPSTSMAENFEKFSVSKVKNIFGTVGKITQMQSEAGVAGALHGALTSGCLATTFTCSQGLLLMIPNMYRIAGEFLPAVIHCSARTIATHALSIFGDHSDIYATRMTGFAMLCSNSPQEAYHMAIIAHLSAIANKIPFLHFFDGFRTSHEIQKIELFSTSKLKKLMNLNEYNKFKNNALSPENPTIRGTAQNSDVFFQIREAGNTFYENLPNTVNFYMDKINKIAKTNYAPFEYFGHKNAENIIIAMGSVCETIEEVINHLIQKNKKVGLVKVRLYRPFSKEYLSKILPKNLKNITILDRTKEPGSIGEPLYLDVLSALKNIQKNNIKFYRGRYGLSGKNTTPSQILAVFENMERNFPKMEFTIGITDDVTNLSLDTKKFDLIDTSNTQFSCKIWGFGSDGSVSSAKNIIKIIGNELDLNVQGYFAYDSKKSGGLTVSHIRLDQKKILSTYEIESLDLVECHKFSYAFKYDILKGLKPHGSLILNTNFPKEKIFESLPTNMKKILIKNKINFYIINASEIAKKLGLDIKINTIMQGAFFSITNFFPIEISEKLMKKYAEKSYAFKGENFLKKNNLAIEYGIKSIEKVELPETFENTNTVTTNLNPDRNQFPVSKLLKNFNGIHSVGTSCNEKPKISAFIPHWIKENCIQCNLCSISCPHSVIRPTILTPDEASKSPNSLDFSSTIGLQNLKFGIVISQMDCTGCENCVTVCPGKFGKKALKMVPASEEFHKQEAFDYAKKLPEKAEIFKKFPIETAKGSQFKKPLLEFPGACAGCGETAYAKLATQLFGEKMLIANATGCSSIWGASYPSFPYTKNYDGVGPAWQNSLFEDNAEFGFGMVKAQTTARINLKIQIKNIIENTKIIELIQICEKFLENFEKNSLLECKKFVKTLKKFEKSDQKIIVFTNQIIANQNFLSKKSIWMFGGDGWAYDIGFSGIDHILSSNENFNILIFDTEIYSNTGGQTSKSTPFGATAKFSIPTKLTPKKDLTKIAMCYPNVYVAQVSIGANPNQCVKAFIEAEKHCGPSLIIAYSPCIGHGINGGMKNSKFEEKLAVETGYFKLFRYNPQKPEISLTFDSSSNKNIADFMKNELRFTSKLPLNPKTEGNL